MAKRKKSGPTPSTRSQPFNNPFGALAGLKPTLPKPKGPPTARERETVVGVEGLKSCGQLVLQREPKGHTGKPTTRLRGLPEHLVPALRSVLGKALGCGASVVAGELVLHGDLAQRAATWLRAHGAREVITEEARPIRRAARSPRGTEGGTRRADIEPGMTVDIVLKKDQRSGVLSRGRIAGILTRSATHPHGIKVRLEDGRVGRVKRIIG